MHTWLYNLPRSAQVGKQNRKNRLSRPGWRSNHDGLKFGLERLEDRVLLSITTETGAAITPTVAITKSGTPSTINVGGAVQYLVIVTHSARDAVTGAVATDVVPAGLTIVSAYPNPPAVNRPTNPSGDTVTISGNTVTDRLGTLGQNGEAFLTINATAAPLPSGTTNMTVTNSASVAFAGTNITSNAVTTTISSTTPLLSISKVSTPEYAHVGGTVTYTITVTNSGGAAGAGAVVTDLIDDPSAFLNLQATDPAGTVTFNNTASGGLLVTDRLGAVPAYGTETLTITGRAAPIRGGDSSALQNTAQGWIGALYEDILGRATDRSGAAFWQHELAIRGAGGRDGIVRDLLTTPEAAHLVLDSFYPATGGASLLPTPGTPAGTGSTDLALITGDGWENLYLQGPFGSQPQGNDSFFDSLTGDASWDDVQLLLLETRQFDTNPYRPIT